ncbi:MAG TPA: glycosyltransferase family 2 protein [Kofleriaceae bacterium]|nr:glycosyltransferase family 2 protein [Kofleriaceae bacterium]
MRLLVIIPAFNEQAALGGLLREIRALPGEPGVAIETAVVDDGSTDRTAEVARAGGARLLRLCRNLGIGGAVQAGLVLAHREGFDFAVQIDGDGQHPPGELARLLAAARGGAGGPGAGAGAGPEDGAPDLVVGTRYRDRAGGFRSTALRRFGSAWLRLILRVVPRLTISDPTSGFRLYGPRALRLFADTYPYDFPEPESLAMARAAGLRVVETPVTMRERQGGQSSISGFKSAYYMLKVTVAVVLAYLRTRRPVPAGGALVEGGAGGGTGRGPEGGPEGGNVLG